MAENVPDGDHREEFTSQHRGDDTATESKHGGDLSIDLPMLEGDADLSLQVGQKKSGHETVVHIVYIL
jgi:hypothetical protein